jgi:hypothetical protein
VDLGPLLMSEVAGVCSGFKKLRTQVKNTANSLSGCVREEIKETEGRLVGACVWRAHVCAGARVWARVCPWAAARARGCN